MEMLKLCRQRRLEWEESGAQEQDIVDVELDHVHHKLILMQSKGTKRHARLARRLDRMMAAQETMRREMFELMGKPPPRSPLFPAEDDLAGDPRVSSGSDSDVEDEFLPRPQGQRVGGNALSPAVTAPVCGVPSRTGVRYRPSATRSAGSRASSGTRGQRSSVPAAAANSTPAAAPAATAATPAVTPLSGPVIIGTLAPAADAAASHVEVPVAPPLPPA